MSTDRELLELAAKAADEVIDRWALDENGVEYAWLESGDPWQPLHRNTVTDCMGDALRLMVTLRLHVSVFADAIGVGTPGRGYVETKWTGDPYAATRRAVVRAAAELGRKS